MIKGQISNHIFSTVFGYKDERFVEKVALQIYFND